MPQRAEPEIHDYIDSLCKDDFYGELTIYFQKGEIGNVHQKVNLRKRDIVEQYRASMKGDGASSALDRKGGSKT